MAQDVGYTQDCALYESLLESGRITNLDRDGRDVVFLHRSSAERSIWRSVVNNDLWVLETGHVAGGRVLHVGANIKGVDTALGCCMQINKMCEMANNSRHQVV